MIDARYLENCQPIIYRTFVNALNKKQVSHAYLLSGEPGTPLLACATFLAKSLLCDKDSLLACNECFTCLRVDDGNYADFILLDGSTKTIKKDDIQRVESTFEKKALEKKGIMIYIIHLVENMTLEAINSLLKFLEEPNENIYAFLTTENELKVLPTIISRTQRLPIKKLPQEEVIRLATELGVLEEDAEILSFFYNDETEIEKIVNQEEYTTAKENVIAFLSALIESEEKALFIMQKDVIANVKTKESARFFIDLLSVFLKEVVAIQGNQKTVLSQHVTLLNDLASVIENINSTIVEIITSRGNIDLNVSLPLLLDHIALQFMKGGDKNGRK